ncbi:NAD(P)H-dependent oxidoreductase [Paenibacillus thalictri]|uniref:NAD(P)-dependent oxidoreductase n=1 Tax=Paenibacillus thalictri TaxID=2527873 RepID=A0A4Q9DZ27_9BACL|nr:NAD(P)-dependent oxidoreductase [Paenibacillus thalictri]TBL81676.1 NAD(P)-dependent oxidoreductase [Paenibacillus thalictri]
MLGLNRKLAELHRNGGYIRVGLIGAGQMGRGMISQIEAMLGMRVVITADLFTDNIKKAYTKAGVDPSQIKETNDRDIAEKAIAAGYVVATSDAEMVPHLDQVDVIVDATGITNIGAKIAWNAIVNKKHIVMLNVETDVTVGPLLKKMAEAAGVVYTGSAGDEPGAIMELYDFADAIGFEIVALGKGKNNPLNVHANPDTAAEEAKQKGASPKMLASFQDGTKTMVEMTAVANATGFVPDVQGMHGIKATVQELPGLLKLKQDGGILNRKRVVEYVNGVAPGVFAIISSDKKEVHEELKYLKMGDGPNYVLFRPFHLTSLETPLSIAKAYFHKEATIAPYAGLVAETVSVAKKTLKPGDVLDGIGCFTAYGRIMTAEDQRKTGALPLGLIGPNIRLKREVAQDQLITFDDIEIVESNMILRLREMMMEQLLASGASR